MEVRIGLMEIVLLCLQYVLLPMFLYSSALPPVIATQRHRVSHLYHFAGTFPAVFTWLTSVEPSRFRRSHNSSRKPSRDSWSWAYSPSHWFLLFLVLFRFNYCCHVCLAYLLWVLRGAQTLPDSFLHLQIEPNCGTREVLRRRLLKESLMEMNLDSKLCGDKGCILFYSLVKANF